MSASRSSTSTSSSNCGALPADERIPGMRAHLEGCPACHEDYDSLRELVQSERPQVEESLQRDRAEPTGDGYPDREAIVGTFKEHESSEP